MTGIKIDKERKGAIRSVLVVLILILHIGGVFAVPKNVSIAFELLVIKGHDNFEFQEFMNPERKAYEIPLHDGDLTIFIRANTFNKLVNPYPSDLNALTFIKDNTEVIEGSLYVLALNEPAYSPSFDVLNLVMDVETTSKQAFIKRKGALRAESAKIAVGQVFYVMAKDKDGFVIFNNSQRKCQTQKENRRLPILKIGLDYVSNNGVIMHRQLGLSFKKGNTYTHESGYDSELYDLHTTENDMYWDFGNGKKYVIAGLQSFDEYLEIPLVLQIKSKELVRLSVDLVQNITQKVYLYDSITHEKGELSSLGVTLDLEKGIYKDRFYIGFKTK